MSVFSYTNGLRQEIVELRKENAELCKENETLQSKLDSMIAQFGDEM